MNEPKDKLYNEMLKKLKTMKDYIDNIKKELNYLTNNFIPYIQNAIKSMEVLEKYISDYMISLEGLINYSNDFNKQKLYKKITDQNEAYLNNNFIIYKSINNLKDYNEELKDLIINIEPFDPPNINSFNYPEIDINSYNQNSIIKYEDERVDSYLKNNNSNSYIKFINKSENENNEEIEDTKELSKICLNCKKKDFKFFCKEINQLLCYECLEKIKKEKGKELKIEFIDNTKDKIDPEKTLFFNSINQIIKDLLLKCNFLLKNEKIRISNDSSQSTHSKNYIKRIINFPYIKDPTNFNSQIEYLKDINNVIIKDFHKNDFDLNDFYLSEINQKLLYSIQDIFMDEKINLFRQALEVIENNFDDEIETESLKKKEINLKEFDAKKNMFYYVISLIPQRENIEYNKSNINYVLIKKMNEILNIKDYNIILSFNNKYYFINSIIKTKEFYDSTIDGLKKDYPGFDKLYEYKIIYDFILKILGKKNFDYRGNTICPNSTYNLIRGTEKYDPPYGWFGIGLNVIDKDNNDWLDKKNKWAIAYYGVGNNLSSHKILEMLKNIIETKKLIRVKNDRSICSSQDRRHPEKKVGTGIYLSPKIKIAEEFSGKISIDNKKYKVVLMTKVLIDKIKEPFKLNVWVLNVEDIKIYRILLKEVG